MPVFNFDSAIVRLPGNTVHLGLRAGDHGGPSFQEVAAEHAAYVRALEAAGVTVDVLPALDHLPDSVFVEDPALVFSEAAIVLRMRAPSRGPEVAELEPALRARFDRVLSLPTGFVDGGDVLVTPDTVFVGLSARTDIAGAQALVELLRGIGRRGQVVQPPAGTLHLKTATSLLDEETLLITAALAATGRFAQFRTLIVPDGEERAANALRVNDSVLVAEGCPATRDLLETNGFSVVPLRVDGVGKIDAGLSCMSLRWARPRASGPP